MNNSRRKQLKSLVNDASTLNKEWDHLRNEFEQVKSRIEDWTAKVVTLKDDTETLRDEEQDYKDNMPESIQDGDKGNAADDAISAIEEAMDKFDDIIQSVETINDFDASEIEAQLGDAQGSLNHVVES